MSNLKFSIVTPSFNQAAYIEATIRSVLEQDYQHVEYIIIDGASLDGSVDVIKKYEKKLAAWISEEDNGQTDALNKGFHLATGDIFAWINSDDTYEPGTFKAVAEFFERNPEIGMVYGDAHFIDDEGKRIGKFPAAQTDYARLRAGYVHIPQQAAFSGLRFGKKLARSTQIFILPWITIFGSASRRLPKSFTSPANSGQISGFTPRQRLFPPMIAAGRKCSKFTIGTAGVSSPRSSSNIICENYWRLSLPGTAPGD